jgi:Sulfotransferase domain
MIILSVGMPRAGSGWYYNLTNDLMLAGGARDAHQIRQKYHLQSVLTEVNCNIGALSARRISSVLLPSLLGNTFVIKAHAAPTPFALRAIRRGGIHPTYIYRDPRDAMLSAMESGRRAAERGRPNAFSPYQEFEPAIQFMLEYLHIWEAWMKVEQALHIRYEDLLLNYDFEAQRLIDFLDLDIRPPAFVEILNRYRPEKGGIDQKGSHFSHGRIGRFRKKFDPGQQQVLAERMTPYLEQMGYSI